MYRDDPLAIWPPPETDGRDDLLVGPGTDPGLPVGSDVGGVDRAERCVELPPTRIESGGRLSRLRVTSTAPRRREHVPPLGHQVGKWRPGVGGRPAEQQESCDAADDESESESLLKASNVSHGAHC